MTPNRLPNGWVVLGGSVLASFIWWMASRPSTVVAPAPVPATAPATVEATPVAGRRQAPRPRRQSRARALRRPPPSPQEPAPEAPAPLPLLRVVGDVAGANVFIDRKYVGKTPFETRDITAGGHQINVSAEGYDGMSRHVEVASNGPTEVTFSLKAVVLESAVQVVHKHRLGSCEGRLSADLAGLRYRRPAATTGFMRRWGDRDAGHGLRREDAAAEAQERQELQLHDQGRNADRLLAFHRDVEKARKKWQEARDAGEATVCHRPGGRRRCLCIAAGIVISVPRESALPR